MSLFPDVGPVSLELSMPATHPGLRSARTLIALGVLCGLGMRVVTSLFASPVERSAYRPPAAQIVRSLETQQPAVRTVNDRRVGRGGHC